MPLFNNPLPGSNVTLLMPGQSMVLFDGTESPGAGLVSIAFARGRMPGGGPAGQVFSIAFAAAPTATVQIQASNDNVNYVAISAVAFPLSPVVNGSWFADLGEFAFYRAALSAYSSGGMPIVTVA